MIDVPANPPALELAGPKPPGAGWTRTRWLTVIAFVFATHIALIVLFGEKKEIVPRAVTNVPMLTLANDSDGLLALNDPTLFVLPHQRDFAAAGFLKMKPVNQPASRYTEPVRPLPFSDAGLGATFGQFMQTNFFAIQPLDFKPAAEFSTPTLPVEPVPAQNSTLRIEGELAQRLLPSAISLTNWPHLDVLTPSKVQLLVDVDGHVSPVLLESSSYKEADDEALKLARSLRFTPSSGLTFGWVIFNWHTVPPETTTNEGE